MVLGDQTYSLKLDRPSPMSYTHFEDPFNTFDFASLVCICTVNFIVSLLVICT